jgi:hypothetical protein
MGVWKVTAAEFDAWSRAEKRRRGLWSALHFMSKNNTGGRQIVSLHWPHLLCWEWTLGWHPHRPGYDTRRFGLFISRLCKQIELAFWIGSLHFSWQNYQRISALGLNRPEVDWGAEHARSQSAKATS